MRLARPHAILLATATLLLALSGAGAWGGTPTELFDPARDAAVYRTGVNVPVDSTDIVRAALDDADGAIEGASLRLVDLDRMGFESFLFTGPQEHTVRVWGFVSFLEDRTALTAVAVKYDPPMNGWDLGAIGLILRPDGTYEDVQAQLRFDVARDTVAWTFGKPVPVRPLTFVAFAGTTGCDREGSCLAAPRVSSVDGVPDGGGAYVASVQTFAWWHDVFPSDGEASPLHEARRAVVDAWANPPSP